MAPLKKTGVLISGGGTNLQALIDQVHGKDTDIVLVVSNKKDAFGLKRAEKAGIPTAVLEQNGLTDEAYNTKLAALMKEAGAELIVLAGYMKIMTKEFLDSFPGAVINIHPALIPSFCGKGCYGLHVHQAALDYGVKLSGATVHFVNEEADAGPIIAQKAVEVLPDDTPETLQARILEQAEHVLLPYCVRQICLGNVIANGRNITIRQAQDAACSKGAEG